MFRSSTATCGASSAERGASTKISRGTASHALSGLYTVLKKDFPVFFSAFLGFSLGSFGRVFAFRLVRKCEVKWPKCTGRNPTEARICGSSGNSRKRKKGCVKPTRLTRLTRLSRLTRLTRVGHKSNGFPVCFFCFPIILSSCSMLFKQSKTGSLAAPTGC